MREIPVNYYDKTYIYLVYGQTERYDFRKTKHTRIQIKQTRAKTTPKQTEIL